MLETNQDQHEIGKVVSRGRPLDHKNDRHEMRGWPRALRDSSHTCLGVVAIDRLLAQDDQLRLLLHRHLSFDHDRAWDRSATPTSFETVPQGTRLLALCSSLATASGCSSWSVLSVVSMWMPAQDHASQVKVASPTLPRHA